MGIEGGRAQAVQGELIPVLYAFAYAFFWERTNCTCSKFTVVIIYWESLRLNYLPGYCAIVEEEKELLCTILN